MGNTHFRPTGAVELFPAAMIFAGLGVLAAATVAGRAVAPAAGLLVLISLVAVAHRFLLRWDVLIAILVLVVLLIPIKRYEFGVSLPFDLEPYRVYLALLIGLWLGALLADPRVSMRSSLLDAPLALIYLAVVGSVVVNPDNITRLDVIRSFVGTKAADVIRDATRIPYADVSATVAKALLFLSSVFLAYYLIVSLVRTPQAILRVVRVLVLGSAGVAVSAIVERRTGYNVFDHLQGVVPLLSFEGGLEEAGIARGGRLRVYASAQHPIALAALFVMVLPLSVYLARRSKQALWIATSAALALGALATVSRTSVTMLAAVGVVFLVLRRAALKRVALLALPVLIVVHLALPGTIGSLRQAFFPSEGLVTDQSEFGGRLSSERLDPQFEIIKQQPALGQGYGTRITSGPGQNARVLDNQWLSTAVETGLLGLAAWIWLFVRFVRRAGGEARRDLGDRGWLLTCLTASVVAYAVGMLTFDSLSFIQAMFVFFVILALGSAVIACRDEWPEEDVRATARASSGRLRFGPAPPLRVG